MSFGDRARNTLLKCGKIIADHYGYELSTVGERAGGDHRFFERMADGRNLGFDKYEEVTCFLRGHWPHGVKWPSKETFDPPEPSEVRSFMAALPKKRWLAKPKSKSNSPASIASKRAKAAPVPVAMPPSIAGAGEFSGQKEHQG